MSQESRCNLAESSVQSLFLDCYQDVSWVGFSSEGWSGEGRAFKFTDRVVKRLWVLPDRRPELLSDCCPGAILSSLPQALPTMATRSIKARGAETWLAGQKSGSRVARHRATCRQRWGVLLGVLPHSRGRDLTTVGTQEPGRAVAVWHADPHVQWLSCWWEFSSVLPGCF